MGTDGIRPEALAGSRAGVLHVTPYHSYPSGVTATAAKRREYAAWARERDACIIEDDYDSELSVSLPQIETIASLEPERVIYYSCTVPVFDQLVLAEFIRSGELERRISRLRRKRRAEEAKTETRKDKL